MTFVELGKRFVEFGRALQDEQSTIEEIYVLAYSCGLQLEFRLAPLVDDAAPDKSEPTGEPL